MELNDVANYLGATAASDGPINGREKDLMRHLLKDFGASSQQAQELVSELPGVYIDSLLKIPQEKDIALKLLRGLLVISYSDGSFDKEELPYLRRLLETFEIKAEDLGHLKLQALYFLRQDPPSIKVPKEFAESENWDGACEFAHQQYDMYRRDFYQRFQDDLSTSDESTCFLAMSAGPPSFDTEHTRDRFLQSNPDFVHLGQEQGLELLRNEAEKRLRNQWEAAYTSRCNFCYLEAPGKRRDTCPRCDGEYGVSARR